MKKRERNEEKIVDLTVIPHLIPQAIERKAAGASLGVKQMCLVQASIPRCSGG